MTNNNPNTIYAFADGMTIPTNLSKANVVSGKHATHINLVGENPFFIPISFQADSASFTYTFPQDEKGTGWHAFTLPFRADSIYVDGIPVALDDSLKHFWIYEFVAQGGNEEVIFAPVTELRSATPYIIAVLLFSVPLMCHSIDLAATRWLFRRQISSSVVLLLHRHPRTAIS